MGQYDHSLLQVLRIFGHKVLNGKPVSVQSVSSSNGNRQTVLLVANRRINQMALCKPAIIFFYGVQKPMKLVLQLAPFTTSADGVLEF